MSHVIENDEVHDRLLLLSAFSTPFIIYAGLLDTFHVFDRHINSRLVPIREFPLGNSVSESPFLDIPV